MAPDPTDAVPYTVIVRVWLPDRPGALGQVTSRIGAVRGDVIDIEILEIGGGRVIDELVVVLPSEDLIELMTNEVHAIDDVSVEHVRPAPSAHTDGGLAALALAAEFAESPPEGRLTALVATVARLVEADWVMLVADGTIVESMGEPPSADWVSGLVAGTSHLADHNHASASMLWAELPVSGLWVAAARPSRTVHDRERVRLDLFARVADAILMPI